MIVSRLLMMNLIVYFLDIGIPIPVPDRVHKLFIIYRYFPNELKLTGVTPIFKKDNTMNKKTDAHQNLMGNDERVIFN